MQTCPWSPKVLGPRPKVSSWHCANGSADGEVCAGVVLLKPLAGASVCSKSCSTLALFVTRVGADDDDPAVTAGNLAILTDLLDAWLNLHGFSFFRPLPLRRGGYE